MKIWRKLGELEEKADNKRKKKKRGGKEKEKKKRRKKKRKKREEREEQKTLHDRGDIQNPNCLGCGYRTLDSRRSGFRGIRAARYERHVFTIQTCKQPKSPFCSFF